MHPKDTQDHSETHARFFIDAESREANRISEFVRDAKPDNWRTLAGELRNAAVLLWNDRSNGLRAEHDQVAKVKKGKRVQETETRHIYAVSRPFVLLAGFSLENLLKGLLVEANPELIISGTIGKLLKSHNLENLASQVRDVEFDIAEIAFFRIAGSAIPFWGRYPIPTFFNRVVPEVGMTEDHFKMFSNLFDRLDRELYSKIRGGWQLDQDYRALPIYDAKYDSPERLEEVLRLSAELLGA